MSSKTAAPAVETGWDPNPNIDKSTIPLKDALAIVIPVLCVVSVAIFIGQCCRYRRRRLAVLRPRIFVVLPGDLEEGKPDVYDIVLDAKAAGPHKWKDFTPLYANIVSPKEPEPEVERIDPLSPELLMVHQMRNVAQMGMEVFTLPSKPPSNEEIEPDLKLVTGVIVQMPSQHHGSRHQKSVYGSQEEEYQLPELVLGCEEVPWRRPGPSTAKATSNLRRV